MATKVDDVRGAEKKEAFHRAAEAGVHSFSFDTTGIELPDMGKVHVKLAGTDSCRASVQILRNGGDNNLHYHPNMDLIYMVLKGRVRFYGPNEAVLGEYGPHEGLLLPENARYWFKSVGADDAWLLQIAGYPKGAAASKRIPCEPRKASSNGHWIGLTEAEKELQRRNNRA